MKTKTPYALAALMALSACASQSVEPSVSVEPQPQPRAPVQLQDLKIPPSRTNEIPVEQFASQRPTEKESLKAVSDANAESTILPTLNCFSGSTCQYWYDGDRPYRVNLAVGDQTLVCVKPGEIILDTSVPGNQEWVVNQQFSYGHEGQKRQCVALMPRGMIPGGVQAWVFTPDRPYNLDLRTYRNKKHKHHRVLWQYPEDEVAKLNGIVPVVHSADDRDRTTGMHPRQRYCGYEISGGTPAWRPVQTSDGQPPVCDDGQMIVINFAPGVLGPYQSPTLQRVADGTRLPLDYRQHNATYIVPGIQDEMLLSIGAEEISIRRKQQGEAK